MSQSPVWKTPVARVIAGILVGAWGILQLGGWDWFKDRVIRRPRIVVSSLSDPGSREHLAGQQLLISLQNVRTTKVLWIFDESKLVHGQVDVQYAFGVDPQVPRSGERDYVVAAVYQRGASYDLVWRLVRIRNFYNATIVVGPDNASVNAPLVYGDDFSLVRMSISRYRHGRFEPGGLVPVDFTRGSETATASVSVGEVRRLLGEPGFRELGSGLVGRDDVWLRYDYTGPGRATTLSVVQPLQPTGPSAEARVPGQPPS